jgi:hypothetical protein
MGGDHTGNKGGLCKHASSIASGGDLMPSKATKGIRIKDGRVQRVHWLSVSQRIGGKKKAEREERKWLAKTKASRGLKAT